MKNKISAPAVPVDGLVPVLVHTPTPWKIADRIPHPGYDLTIRIISPSQPFGPDLVATVDLTRPDTPTSRANAAFIVRACNAHEALVEALADLTRHFAGDAGLDRAMKLGIDAEVMAARDILKLADTV